MASLNAVFLRDYFDCVMMLTWSDWHTEMRSNRYHYGSRFAQHLPVIFVQPDLQEPSFEYEQTEIRNLTVLHVYKVFGSVQNKLLNQALHSRNYIKPLLWMYNVHFTDFIISRYAPLKVYHATEDYFNPTFLVNPGSKGILTKLRRTLKHSDLVVAVSEGVKDSYLEHGKYDGEIIVLQNGCDFKFWGLNSIEIERIISSNNGKKKIAFYQGGISYKLDFELIDFIVTNMPDWKFWFCGEVFSNHDDWEAIKKYRNVKYFGKLHPKQVRALALEASVALIPFVQNDWLVNRSFPLKAFEYVACGLPVVSIPIKTLQTYDNLFEFAQTPHEFIEGIRRIEPSRYDATTLESRLKLAELQDYDKRFDLLIQKLNSLVTTQPSRKEILNILILYDYKGLSVNSPEIEHLRSFALFSQHSIYYLTTANNSLVQTDLTVFDIIIIHPSIRLDCNNYLSNSDISVLQGYGGIKVLFVRDENELKKINSEYMKELGVQLIYIYAFKQDAEITYPLAKSLNIEIVLQAMLKKSGVSCTERESYNQQGHKRFIQEFDQILMQKVSRSNGISLISGLITSLPFRPEDKALSSDKKSLVLTIPTTSPMTDEIIGEVEEDEGVEEQLISASKDQLLVTPTNLMIEVIWTRVDSVVTRELSKYPLFLRVIRLVLSIVGFPLYRLIQKLWEQRPQRFRNAHHR